MGKVYAQHSCAIGLPGGRTTYIHEGEAYDDQHPAVVAKPHLFAAPAVEAPAAPLEEEPRTSRRKKRSEPAEPTDDR